MEELGAFPRVFFFCLVGFFLYSLLNAQMCLGCKEQKQIQEKGAVSWTIGVHWTFAFVSQLAVSWCRLLHIYSILPRLRMQSTRGYSFFFSYNLQHTPGSWLESWLDEVHTKNQPLWSSFRNATRPTPPKVLRSLRRHTCTSEPHKVRKLNTTPVPYVDTF